MGVAIATESAARAKLSSTRERHLRDSGQRVFLADAVRPTHTIEAGGEENPEHCPNRRILFRRSTLFTVGLPDGPEPSAPVRPLRDPVLRGAQDIGSVGGALRTDSNEYVIMAVLPIGGRYIEIQQSGL